MKKIIFFLLVITGNAAMAQVPEDALRYSWYPQNGTARNMAIGGAMGSLGGDITALFVNPAGLGFYKTSEGVISPAFQLNKNKFNFRGTGSDGTKNAFNFGPTGFILAGSSGRTNPTSAAISIGITQVANFNNVTSYKGLNNLSSFSESFAEEFARSGLSPAEVLNVNSFRPYGAAPAIYTFLIDTITVNGKVIVKAAPDDILDAGQALSQEYYRKTSGGLYELALGMAVNNKEKWFFGGSLGIPIVYYNSNTTFKEADTSNNPNNGFAAMEFNDRFTTSGAGVNLKLGAIYRPKEYIRIGLALHTPSFMWLRDERTTMLTTKAEGLVYEDKVSSEMFTNDQPGQNKYIQMSPWKGILSASYVFREIQDVTKQKGFITADIEYVNHKGSRFTNNNKDVEDADEQYSKDLNKVIKEIYRGAFNFRVGGELKFNTIMGRLGFAYYTSPYKEADFKANRMLMSTGIGYRNKGFFIDLTYVYNLTKDVNFPYRLEGQANTYATVNQQQNNIVTTVGWKF